MAVQTQIQTRRGAAATWTSTNPTLAAGEIGFESDTNKFKIGTGSTAWASLPYAASLSPLTTKGDLYTYSTADARLPVGPDGSTVVADSSTSTGLRYQGNYAAGKNLVINGNMNVAQRGTSVANATTEIVADRFVNRNNGLGVFTASQETDAPAGFGSSMKWLCTTADASPAAGDFAIFRTTLEAQSLQGLAKGTASAKTTTVSFWVKSNVTGAFVFALADVPNNRSIRSTYTILAADTWEKKTITFAGDTTGTIPNTTASGIGVQFWLGSGSDRNSGTLNTSWATNVTANEAVGCTNLAATLNNYWMVTGVQWEIGNVATDFQLSAGTIQGEIAACQRYYVSWNNPVFTTDAGIATGFASSTTSARIYIPLPVRMRTTPTTIDFTASGLALNEITAGYTVSSILFQGAVNNPQTVCVTATVASGLTQWRPYFLNVQTSTAFGIGAEL